jgi:adenylosuccinate synthase
MDILLGLQWGDEGKGKIADILAPKYDVIARFQGGPNAGHTLVFDGKKQVLHQIPSGIFHSQIANVIGNGVILDLSILRKEVESLKERNVDARQNLYISEKAHLILPTHRLLDAAYEQERGEGKIGSTLKGISPTYQDKIGRNGLRVGDILTANFKEKYKNLKSKHTQILTRYEFEYNLDEAEKAFFAAVEFFKTFKIIDTLYYLEAQKAKGKKIVAEGAQGTLLDIDFGAYPFVTSSNTSAAAACTGLGVAPKEIKEVFGIFKAYCTRVGSGPFPTELLGTMGEKIQALGHEFGATTGRPRRCGWLDLPALRYAVIVNGVTQLFMMKSDILDDFDEISVCTEYQYEDGSRNQEMPYDTEQKITPIYTQLKGWNNFDADKVKSFEDLPTELQDYMQFIEKYLTIPITILSYGPDRKETLINEKMVF